MAEVFTSLEDEQQLRVLQLNSWQLMRLLHTHLTGLGCGRLSCASNAVKKDGPERFCCSYLDATALHESWKSENFSRSGHGDHYRSITSAYHEFLKTANAWLSSRATDKPVVLLASGIGAMVVSCVGLMNLLLLLGQEVHLKRAQNLSDANGKGWHLDESFVLLVIIILILSMGSSSMVEEEQYIWHFMTSSLYVILLRKGVQSFRSRLLRPSVTWLDEQKTQSLHHIFYIVAVLISGRILRAWHQGGVNWSYLPDISKSLEQAGVVHIKSLQLVSVLTVLVICFAALLALQLKIRTVMMFWLIYLFPVLLILKQNYQNSTCTSSSVSATAIIQIIYTLLGISTMGILFATPWLMPLQYHRAFGDASSSSDGVSLKSRTKYLLEGYRDSIYVIGWCYIFSWCLLQLLLQRPVNAMPVALLLVQILASILCFSDCNLRVKQWVKVAALYYIGMAGHFGLGNTNTLATIDVAGAFIGISSHSTVKSGILMFIFTYASPILGLLSMLMNVDLTAFNDAQNVDLGHLLMTTVGYPCLLPLGINSILLLSYTIVLLLMQNHLFVWSVFSPKYLYVCATTACVYIGVSIVALTGGYTCMVFAVRTRLKGSRRDHSS